MAPTAAPATYYAVTSSSAPHAAGKGNHVLATLTLSGSEEATKYTCTGDVKIKLEAVTKAGSMEESPSLPTFQTGDGKLYLEGATGLDSSSGTSVDFDLKEIQDESNEKTISNVSFALTGTDTEKTLTGDLEIANRADAGDSDGSGNQNYLADKSFKVTVTLEKISCSVDKATD